MSRTVPIETVKEIMDAVMNRFLYLAESSLHPCQYKPFRKLALDFLEEGKRKLEQGRCGEESKTKAKEGCFMSG